MESLGVVTKLTFTEKGILIIKALEKEVRQVDTVKTKILISIYNTK